ncbi:MAG TPA: DUF533 domain-containing protein [Vicinamibacterales bacterium]|nr:DUF533 domain-containing protein [Vicinamibacterales bacterium]
MDESVLFGSVMRGLFGVRRKRSMRALRYVTGGGGGFLSNPATLLTAVGLAWGVVDTLRENPSGSIVPPVAPPTTASAAAAAPGATLDATVPPPIPPIPDAAPSTASPAAPPVPASPEVLRLIRLAISAAYADGEMNDHERAAVAQQAQAAGAADILERELAAPRPLREIVAGVTDAHERATLYVLAFTVLRADEHVTGAERIYLAQLANLLGLEPDTIAALEKDTGERIDALGDQGQPGG